MDAKKKAYTKTRTIPEYFLNLLPTVSKNTNKSIVQENISYSSNFGIGRSLWRLARRMRSILSTFRPSASLPWT